MAANTELLHEGLVRNLTASRISTQRTIAQLERMLAVAPEESVVVQTARVASDDATGSASWRQSATPSIRPTRPSSRGCAAST